MRQLLLRPHPQFVMRDHSKTPRYPHQGSANALLWRRPAACSRCDWVKPEEGALSSADNGHQLALWQRDCKVKRRRRRNKKKKNMRTQSERQSKGFWECERNRWKKRDELKGFFCCFFALAPPGLCSLIAVSYSWAAAITSHTSPALT